MTVDRVNRVAVAVTGLAALGVGGWLVAREQQWGVESGPLLGAGLADDLDGLGRWWLWLGISLLVLVVASSWVLAQFGPLRPEVRRRVLIREPDRVTIDTRAAARAAAADLSDAPGVATATARLARTRPDPRVRVDLELAERGDVTGVRRRVEQSIDDFARSVGLDDCEAEIVVSATAAKSRRVE